MYMHEFTQISLIATLATSTTYGCYICCHCMHCATFVGRDAEHAQFTSLMYLIVLEMSEHCLEKHPAMLLIGAGQDVNM